jgi:hypothetical protein
MSEENPLWGSPRIHAELKLLGFNVAESAVAKYRIRIRKPPSQTWKTFLSNHSEVITGIDFFTVPSVTFRNLYCFIILLHDRRTIVHFNVTDHPTAAWTTQQIIETFPEDTSPRFLLRDRDSIYGEEFRSRVKGMQIEELITAPHSPWQTPYVERVIGSIRRECLDYVIVLSEAHLRKILKQYICYYHNVRPHEALEKNSPIPRVIKSDQAVARGCPFATDSTSLHLASVFQDVRDSPSLHAPVAKIGRVDSRSIQSFIKEKAVLEASDQTISLFERLIRRRKGLQGQNGLIAVQIRDTND